MARVSEASSIHAINHAVGKTKSRVEDLQLQGSNLKRVQKPSDDPIGNVELLAIRSQNVDAKQYLRNVSYAKAQLTFTENAIEDLTNILVKAKEIGIGQASNLFEKDVRQSVAREVEQLHKQALSVGNRRLSNRFIFGGYRNLSKPFNINGTYNGDNNQTKLEVEKDFFIPVNFSGEYVFFDKTDSKIQDPSKIPFEPDNLQNDQVYREELAQANARDENGDPVERRPASVPDQNEPIPTNYSSELAEKNSARRSIFDDLKNLQYALETNNHTVIQDLLPNLDKGIDRLIEIRTKIGSIINTVDNAEQSIERTKLLNAEYTTKIEDADVAELFTDLTRQQNTLKATYKASAQMMNNSLMDFIR